MLWGQSRRQCPVNEGDSKSDLDLISECCVKFNFLRRFVSGINFACPRVRWCVRARACAFVFVCVCVCVCVRERERERL